MFGSDNFPLGPNNQFPRKRISNYGVNLIPPVSMQDVYLSGHNTVAKLPSIEKDFYSSIQKAKGRMKQGKMMRGEVRHRDIDRFRPRYAPKSSLRHALGQEDIEEGMEEDVVFDSGGSRIDEGETDDSVGRVIGGRMFSGRMIGSRAIMPATSVRPTSRSVVGSGGWLKGIQRLLGNR